MKRAARYDQRPLKKIVEFPPLRDKIPPEKPTRQEVTMTEELIIIAIGLIGIILALLLCEVASIRKEISKNK